MLTQPTLSLSTLIVKRIKSVPSKNDVPSCRNSRNWGVSDPTAALKWAGRTSKGTLGKFSAASERNETTLRTFALTPRPESGRDCLTFSTFNLVFFCITLRPKVERYTNLKNEPASEPLHISVK